MNFADFNPSSTLEKETGWLFGSDVISMISGLIGQAVLVWVLTGEEYGLFVIALDTCFTVLVLLDSGLSARVTRDVGRMGGRGNFLVQKVVRFQFKFAILLGVFSIFLLRNYWEIEWILGSFSLVLGISIHLTSMTHRGALRSIDLAKHEAFSRIIERLGMTTSYLFLAKFGVSNPEYYAASAGICFMLGGFYSILQWRRNSPPAKGGDALSISWRELIWPAIPFAAGYWLLTVNYRIPKILLGNFVSFSEVGIFNVSMIGFAAALALPNAIRQSSQPIFARLGADEDGISRRWVFFRSRRIARFGTILGLPAGLIAGFYGFPVIFPNLELADGNRLFEILSILMVGWNSILLTSPDWGRVMGHERPFGYAAAIGLSVITQLIGCTFFGSEFGAEEAAISFATGAIFSSLVFLYCTGTTEGRVAMFQGVLEYGFGMSFAVIVIVGDFSGLLQKTMLCLLIGILWHVSVEKLGGTPPQTKGE